MAATITTLFEGHYHLGAAGLINSLHKGGFTGSVVCGLRGPLPPWSQHLEKVAPIQVQFVPLKAAVHLTN
ncbi:MAG TPA: hypothetical protein VHF69_09360, partial [Candidatus Synoicihabitans sp.]|nr:hypothetical protein [Candidatus Synoicihabitans sp.]